MVDSTFGIQRRLPSNVTVDVVGSICSAYSSRFCMYFLRFSLFMRILMIIYARIYNCFSVINSTFPSILLNFQLKTVSHNHKCINIDLIIANLILKPDFYFLFIFKKYFPKSISTFIRISKNFQIRNL